MEWFNPFGLAFMALIMIPNIVFALRCRDGFVNNRVSKALKTLEQICPKSYCHFLYQREKGPYKP